MAAPKKSAAGSSARRLMIDKLAGSGLDERDARVMKAEALNGRQTSGLSGSFHGVDSMRIPYFDFNGKPSKFYRIRYLGEITGFAGQLAKPQRYAQLPGTVNEVYLPPFRDWRKERTNTESTLYITEGELKAACACKHGLATIGLGGVDVWQSKKRGLDLLPQLKEIQWEGRLVNIVFDSDAATNPNVVRAQLKLALKLTDLGARPSVVSLPMVNGKKAGLDDYLVHKGVKSFMRLVENAENFQLSSELWKLNGEVLYVKDPGIIIVQKTGQILTAGAFKEHAYADRKCIITHPSTGPKSAPKSEELALPNEWLAWPTRFSREEMNYSPGKERVTETAWNLWKGWGCDPVKGDITPWKKLLDHLFEGSPKERRWFEQWCAYPLQHPGTKLFSAVLVWGTKQGTGKSQIGYTLSDIYGKGNSSVIGEADLHGGFNSWAQHKQFVMGEEITGSDKRADADKLKGIITREEVTINAKYQPEFTIRDCVNYYMTSNHCDALFMEDDDRRYFIHEVRVSPLSAKFYSEYHDWRKSIGPSALFHHLLSLDLKGFNPFAPAPMTTSKSTMISLSKSDIGAWVQGLRESPASSLRLLGETAANKCELMTNEQIRRCYDPENATRVTKNGMGRELKRAGFYHTNEGNLVHTEHGPQRLWIIRNPEKWVNAKSIDAGNHWSSFFGKRGKKHA